MVRFLILIVFLLFSNYSFSQTQSFKAIVSNDTVLLGNFIIVKFSIKNTKGDFKAPQFNDFDIISGPNSSSMFTMVNGSTTRESSYTYYLLPKMEGELFINPAYLSINDKSLETSIKKIVVLPNPEGKTIEPRHSQQNMLEFTLPQYDYDIPSKEEQEPKVLIKKKKFKTRKL